MAVEYVYVSEISWKARIRDRGLETENELVLLW